MASFNKVILIGNLTRDPQVRYTPGGMAVSDIGLAVNRTWFDKQTNQKKEDVTFVDVTLWGRTAEVAGEYLAKGKQVLIEGRLQLDSWDDKETGQKRNKLKVIGENMTMLGSRQEGGGRGSGGPAASAGDSGGNFYNQEPPEQSGGFEPSAPSGGEGGGEVPF
ncbi:MAG: single-stranded DNA-binding protein [Planctomycetaceae bacterium]|nr:single-stranded DNA-binding protein [Planctomycetaceae bacterium]